MREVLQGDSILFSKTFYDEDDVAYDPDDVTLKIVRSGTQIVYGPFVYSEDEVFSSSTGSYYRDVEISQYLTPGLYAARWEANNFYGGFPTEYPWDVTPELDEDYVGAAYFEYFSVIEERPDPLENVDPPTRYGIIRESALYQVMGMGLTDRVFLIGHADNLALNSPYEVVDMQEAINVLGADSDSPLLRGLLEAYNAGARDIWLVAAAPMSEYLAFDLSFPTSRLEARTEWDGLNFYERYHERLDATYEYLLEWDLIDIMVPIEAAVAINGLGYDFGTEDDGSDMSVQLKFLTQANRNVYNRFLNTASPSIFMIGTRLGFWSPSDIAAATEAFPYTTEEEMAEIFNSVNRYYGSGWQDNFSNGAAGKFGFIAWGEGTFQLPQMPVSYIASPVCAAAGLLASQRMDRGLTYKKIPHMISPVGRHLTDDEIRSLSRSRFNPLVRTIRGKRGSPFECVLATDNTTAITGSDYWSVTQLRLVMQIIQNLRTLGNRSLGTIGYGEFQRSCEDYMASLTLSNVVKGYTLNIYRDIDINRTVLIDVAVTPYVGLREIFFTVEVGPGDVSAI